MQLPTSKPDWRDIVTQLCVAAAVILTFVAISNAWSLVTAANLLLLGAAGYLLVRLAGRSGLHIPVPRSLHLMRRSMSYRRISSDQPFHTRLGWTSDAEPGGSLPDACKVTPFGPYGGGLYADGFVGGLLLAALFAVVFAAHPLAALIIPLYVLAYGVIGFALVSLVRFLRHH